VVRVPLENLLAGERVLPREAARYLTRVHRLGVGARVVAFDPIERSEADAEIVMVGAEVRLALDAPRPARAVPALSIRVIQCAVKGKKIDGVLRDATELGATAFVVALADRSVPDPDRRQQARWRRVAVEAARQCGRGDVPDIGGPLPLSAALADAPNGVRLVLDPQGVPMGRILELWAREPVTIAVGPEGGFTEEELRCAERSAFERVSLGQFVLRTETACAAALGALLARA
jgi:16S rRNA (uracil1498-N3)-methyltransferase